MAEMPLGIHYNSAQHDLSTYLKDGDVFALRDGFVRTPEGPGLGIEIDEELVRSAAKEYRFWSNPVWRTHDGSIAEW